MYATGVSAGAHVAGNVSRSGVIDGRYRIGRLLAAGGTADVYRAYDETLHRPVAVKVLRVRPDDDHHAQHRNEVTRLAEVNHPGVVSILDAGELIDTAGAPRPYLVLELLEGSTVAQSLTRGPLPFVDTARIGGCLADTLSYLHRRGRVHGDVKPANVLVSADGTGRVTLLDFGIARRVEDDATGADLMRGTPHYLSPEQVAGSPAGPPSDVYGLGLLVLEALTARRPYPGSPTGAAVARLSRPPNIPLWLGGSWRSLLTAMTATDPGRRPTARSVARRLHRMELAFSTAAAAELRQATNAS